MQGIFIDGERPKSKKQIKETVAKDSFGVEVEATSVFGNEYGGPISKMPEGVPIHFVGPDPYTKRNFYGSITRIGNTFKVE